MNLKKICKWIRFTGPLLYRDDDDNDIIIIIIIIIIKINLKKICKWIRFTGPLLSPVLHSIFINLKISYLYQRAEFYLLIFCKLIYQLLMPNNSSSITYLQTFSSKRNFFLFRNQMLCFLDGELIIYKRMVHLMTTIFSNCRQSNKKFSL